MLTVSDILFALLGFGFGVGCTIRVGQLLGARRPAQAKLAGHCHLLPYSFRCLDLLQSKICRFIFAWA